MRAEAQWAAGIVLALAGWIAARMVARARISGPFSPLLDIWVTAAGFACLAAVTARPIFAGLVMFALIGGLAFADHAKRQILREPVLFADMSELVELVRHPALYLPYAGTARIVAGALAAVGGVAILLWLEPPAFTWSMTVAGLAMAAALFLLFAPATVLLKPAGRLMSRFAPSGDAAADSARFGPVAALFIHGVIARAERAGRRAAVAAPAVAKVARSGGPPVVMVQSESFFDVRRLSPAFAPDLLAAFDAAASQGQSGQLSTPAWGANTVRTEFAAISGLDGPVLGFDRFNPYHAFVRAPVSSLAWTLKQRGYKAVCLHPFDRRFYARDKVMQNLGFDLFLGQEAFSAPAKGGYIADADLTAAIAALLKDDGPGLFVFAITMENHGPWSGGLNGRADPAPSLPDIAEGQDLKRYASILPGADAMVAGLCQALPSGGVLAFYGDHLPSLPKAYAALGFAEESTDYLVWRAGALHKGRADIAAHDLPKAILAALDGT